MSKPVSGSASAAMSAASRFFPQPVWRYPPTWACQEGALIHRLQPPPVAPSASWNRIPLMLAGPSWFHTVSLRRVPFALSVSLVPPTATTRANDDGMLGAFADLLPAFALSQLNHPS